MRSRWLRRSGVGGVQLIAGSVGPSHAWVHVVDSAVDVTIAGMAVSPGDLIHADQHGAVTIPLDVARDIPAAAAKIAGNEAVLISAAKKRGFGFADLEKIVRGK